MALPLHERAVEGRDPALMRLMKHGLVIDDVEVKVSSLLRGRELPEGEQCRSHFGMTKCIGCRPCEVACKSIKAPWFVATNPVVAFPNRSDLSRAELQTVCGSYA